MTIPPNRIANYLNTLQFPVDVRDPSGSRRVYINLGRMHLEKMIEEKLVEAIGSRSRIKYIRLRLTPAAKAVMWLKLAYPLISECNQTAAFVRTEGWGHVYRRCLAYGMERAESEIFS